MIVVRESTADNIATAMPATSPPTRSDVTERPVKTKAITMPGVMACAIASPASDSLRRTRNAPIGAIETDKTVVAAKARRIKLYAHISETKSSTALQSQRDLVVDDPGGPIA